MKSGDLDYILDTVVMNTDINSDGQITLEEFENDLHYFFDSNSKRHYSAFLGFFERKKSCNR